MKSWCGAVLLAVAIMAPAQTVFAAQDAAPGVALVPDTDPDVRVMQQVYEGPEFWWKRQQAVETRLDWIDGAARQLRRALAWLWQAVAPVIRVVLEFFLGVWRALARMAGISAGGVGASGASMILWIILPIAVAWLGWKIYPLVRQWLMPDTRRFDLGARQEPLPEAAVLLDQAGALLAAGQGREAIRLAFLALLAHLQHRGLLRYDRSRTTREYLNDLAGHGSEAAVFYDLAQPYERAWFGQLPVDSGEAARVLRICGQLVAPKARPS